MHTDPPKRLKLGKDKQHFLEIIKKVLFSLRKWENKFSQHIQLEEV